MSFHLLLRQMPTDKVIDFVVKLLNVTAFGLSLTVTVNSKTIREFISEQQHLKIPICKKVITILLIMET